MNRVLLSSVSKRLVYRRRFTSVFVNNHSNHKSSSTESFAKVSPSHTNKMVSQNSHERQLRLDWTLRPEQIQQLAQEIIARSKTTQDQVAALPLDQCRFDNVIRPLAQMEAWEMTQSANCYFPQYVSTDKALRDASMAANKLLDQHEIESGMREDVYQRVRAVFDREQSAQGAGCSDDEDRRLLTKIELSYRRNGLALDAEKRKELLGLKKRLSDCCIEFSKAINEDQTQVEFTAAELLGMPQDFMDGLKKVDGNKYVVTMKYPDLFPVMNRAQLEETRRRLDMANSTRCESNMKLLREAIQLREQIAGLLGYPNHAAFVLEVRMAKQPAIANKFLTDLSDRLKPLAEQELKKLLEMKQKEKKAQGAEFDGQINSWDFRYYNHQLLETEYDVDEDKIKEYFSLETVTKGMLDLYQRVLNLKFTEIDKPPVWHSDVRMFEVKDQNSGEMVGCFYLDLFPRDGKYTHAACFGLQPGCVLENGERQYPGAAMVANFSKPSPGRPSLLKHNEVVTYYHELGHVMHQLCSRTRWARFHGTKVERDFVEAPSQMLENWCWEVPVLRQLSEHYERKGEKIPEALCEKIIRSKNVNAGLMNLRQIFFATFDLTVHGQSLGDRDLNELWRKLRDDVSLIPNPPNTFPAATFGHIMGGYDAGYYGYLWSQVFSADMYYSRFKQEGIENGKTGGEYRLHILQPGGSKDGNDMLKNFLGREPTSDAFLRSIGLN